MREQEGLYRAGRALRRIAIGTIVLAVAIVLVGYFFLMRTVDRADAWASAARELDTSVLHYNEPVIRVARVYRRRPTNYFRAANGLLVATPSRILFVGLEPRDKLAGEDAPAAIITSEFANDTLISINTTRLYTLTAHGAVIRRGQRREEYAAARGHDAELDSLVSYVTTRQNSERRLAVSDAELKKAVAAAERRQLRYVIQKGDALSTIAARFGATPAQIREWNHMTKDRVRIRDTLIVKPSG